MFTSTFPLTAPAAGIRHTDFVTQYPSQFTTVQSFDRRLIQELTERISEEHKAKGVNVELGPVRVCPHFGAFLRKLHTITYPSPSNSDLYDTAVPIPSLTMDIPVEMTLTSS